MAYTKAKGVIRVVTSLPILFTFTDYSHSDTLLNSAFFILVPKLNIFMY